MALCSPPPSPSSCKPASSLLPASPSSPYNTHPFPAASQLCPSLIERRGITCSPVRVTAFHTCPDTSSSRTLYQVLQVPQKATQTEIKAAYRRLALLYHPDARGVAVVDEEEDKEARTKLFLQIHSAYATLSDVQSRARYDLQLSAKALQERIARVATPLSAGNSYSSPRASPALSPYRVGRSWETDQCWC